METEIWFNLIQNCAVAHLPLFLVNARLSKKSTKKYARFGQLTQERLRNLTGIAAQTEQDALRLNALGASKVTIMGNLKFDIEPPEAALNTGRILRAQFGNTRPVFLAASTREGEEALLIEMLKTLNIPNLLTIIVPRHPQRFNEVAALLEQHHIPFQRKSGNTSIAADTSVVLGDSMGEMFAYYAASDIAFIGGSLLPYGGQNLIEACAVGRPVLIGPHTYNFSTIVKNATEIGAAIQVQDIAELRSELTKLLNDADTVKNMSAAGINFSRLHQGATQRVKAD